MSNLNLNKAVIGGRLTADIELKTTTSGISVCSFSVAVNRKTGKDQEPKTDFIDCVAWRKTAEFISQYFKKGSSICVWGSIQKREWQDNNGNKRYATELVVDEAYFVDSKSENASSYSAQPAFSAQPAANFEDVTNEDDLPF